MAKHLVVCWATTMVRRTVAYLVHLMVVSRASHLVADDLVLLTISLGLSCLLANHVDRHKKLMSEKLMSVDVDRHQ